MFTKEKKLLLEESLKPEIFLSHTRDQHIKYARKWNFLHNRCIQIIKQLEENT